MLGNAEVEHAAHILNRTPVLIAALSSLFFFSVLPVLS
jgi:hypothetical protein